MKNRIKENITKIQEEIIESNVKTERIEAEKTKLYLEESYRRRCKEAR